MMFLKILLNTIHLYNYIKKIFLHFQHVKCKLHFSKYILKNDLENKVPHRIKISLSQFSQCPFSQDIPPPPPPRLKILYILPLTYLLLFGSYRPHIPVSAHALESTETTALRLPSLALIEPAAAGCLFPVQKLCRIFFRWQS